MIPSRWQRLEDAFNGARELRPEARAEYLARVCGDDPDLLSAVESLLRHPTATGQLPAAAEVAAAVEGRPDAARLIGCSVGSYRIDALIAAGGMGVVYRAHDTKLHRDVALKVLPDDFKADSNRRKRVEREARALAALNHPNVAAIYDFVGEGENSPALVLELVDDVLSNRIRAGAFSVKDTLYIARQIAEGLQAAHEKGIIHRDLKPSNIALNARNKAKVLDFGLAKTFVDINNAETTGRTVEGMLVGTPAYMSPEQARCQPVDKRTDIWAFGCVVYEMLVGRKAFGRDSTSDTIAAVLQDPPDWGKLPADTPANVRRLLERCLEKDPSRRLHDIADARLELDDLGPARPAPPRAERHATAGRWRTGIEIAALLVLGATGGVWWFTQAGAATFEQLTFSRGRIGGARFGSSGAAVVYSAAIEGRPLEVARVDLADGQAGRSLNYPPASDVLSARAGEVALSLRRRFVYGERFIGTLAVAPLGGGTPRELAENIEDADWDASSGQLAVVRSTGDSLVQSTLEFPIGRILYKTTGSIRFVRVSRDGQRVAFLEDPLGRGTSGHVSYADRNGKVIRLTGEWDSARGLAWSADGAEIWFTAGAARANRAIRAVGLDGKERLVYEAPGSFTLWDIAPDGRLLMSRDEERRALVGAAPGDSAERDLSLYDDSGLSDISNDGRWILGRDRSTIYLRATDSSSSIQLLNGNFADAISPDGKKVLATIDNGRTLVVVPTGAGSPQRLPKSGFDLYRGARWFPDGRRIFFTGSEPGKDSRSFIQDLDGGLPKPFTPEGSRALAVSPTGDTLAVEGGNEVTLWPVAGGPPRALLGAEPGDRPVVWSDDGRSLWMFHRGEVPAPVYQLEIATGRRQLWKSVVPPDAAGVFSIIEFKITPDGRAYAYSYVRLLSQLYLVHGLGK